MKELSEFDSPAFKRRCDEYWAEPMCECDGQSAPFGKAGFYCDECGREIPVRSNDDREGGEDAYPRGEG